MERDRVIISGINGFVGNHLAKELNNSGVEVVGIGQEDEVNPEISNIVGEYHQADLVETWPETLDAKAIIHLAGLAAVGPSFEKPQVYINANSAMVTNLCEYYLKQESKPRIILVSSGAIYNPDQTMPINESGDISLSSPYSISKVLNENQAEYYRKRGLDCVVVRPFNHIGPGQSKGFILPDLFERLSQLGENKTITTGNIETRRDYTDVRDIVKAYGRLALAETLKSNIYNICSGKSYSGVEILNILEEIMGLEEVVLEIDQSLVRPNDTPEIIGDSSRLKEELNWQPEIDINQTISDFVKSKGF